MNRFGTFDSHSARRPGLRTAWLLSTSALALFACCGAPLAQSQTDDCSAASSPAGDVSLHLSLKNGQSVFREGEIIALTAEYTAVSKKKYVLNNRSYDRSGRLSGMEVFCIEPDRGVDPLSDYFGTGELFFGGGLFSELDPAEKPFVRDLELNEWETLPAGSYRLSVVGNRIALKPGKDSMESGDSPIPLRSNAVEFRVEAAEPDWQAAQLAAAVSALDSPGSTKDEKEHAARVLRFLGSEASTRELVRRYSSGAEPFGWEMKFGLFGSSNRQVAIDAMQAAIHDPLHPITAEFVDTLVTLEMAQLPKDRFRPSDSSQKAWSQAHEAYEAEHDRRVKAYMAEAADAAAEKSPPARGMTAGELLQSPDVLTPEARARFRQMLVASWDSVPVETQKDLLEFRWDAVGGPEWLPVLEEIWNRDAQQPDGPGRAVALRHILNIAPDRGRQAILEEIESPRGGVGIDVLGKLPEHELPQYDALLMARFRGGDDGLPLRLIDRYASVKILPQMKSVYEAKRGTWDCASRTNLLRYFLRVSPAYGAQEVSTALSGVKTTGCVRMDLSDLKEFVRVPQVEQLAIHALDSSSLNQATAAAQALEEYGSPKAEAALWARLEKFHRKWMDQPDSALHPHPRIIDYDGDSGLERALVTAITNGQAWFVDAAAIRRLKELSSPALQSDLDRIAQDLADGSFEFNPNWWPDGNLQYFLGWYQGTGLDALREKLAQFPGGSHFSMMTSALERAAHSEDVASFSETASAHGQVITEQFP
jgi:hypothetical protein